MVDSWVTAYHSSSLSRPFVAGSPAAVVAQAGGKTDTTRVTELAPITVTGSREESVAPPVSTIEVAPEVLLKAPATNPYDMVRRAAGIEVHEQGQGPGFASDAVIRGFTSDHSSDVLLVIDGVPINLPLHGHVEGYSDWSILSPSAISALRVIHGPASPLYGDFAFGGVVEAFTASDAAGRSGSLQASSYGDVRGWVTSGMQKENGGGPDRARRATGAGLARQLGLLAGQPRAARLAPCRVRQTRGGPARCTARPGTRPGSFRWIATTAVTWSPPRSHRRRLGRAGSS